MEIGKDIRIKQSAPKQEGLVLSAEEKNRLVSFFSILIEIDQRNKKKK